MSDIYNTCQRCGLQRESRELAICDFELGAFWRRYVLCMRCYAVVIEAVKAAVNPSTDKQAPPEAGEGQEGTK